jgi:hypothetical protein
MSCAPCSPFPRHCRAPASLAVPFAREEWTSVLVRAARAFTQPRGVDYGHVRADVDFGGGGALVPAHPSSPALFGERRIGSNASIFVLAERSLRTIQTHDLEYHSR